MKNCFLIVLVVFALSLAGCSASSNGPIPTITPIVRLTDTPDPVCSTKGLEVWVSRSKENTRGFIELLNNSVTINPDQAVAVTSQLAAFRSVLTTLSAPQCVTDERQMIFEMMDTTVEAFNQYATHKKPDIGRDVVNANTQYSKILVRQKQLEDLLNEKFKAAK